MSNQRYSPKFKDEAVRQITERGFTSGHELRLNAKYMTATQTYDNHQKSACKRDGSYMTSQPVHGELPTIGLRIQMQPVQ